MWNVDVSQKPLIIVGQTVTAPSTMQLLTMVIVLVDSQVRYRYSLSIDEEPV